MLARSLRWALGGTALGTLFGVAGGAVGPIFQPALAAPTQGGPFWSALQFGLAAGVAVGGIATLVAQFWPYHEPEGQAGGTASGAGLGR